MTCMISSIIDYVNGGELFTHLVQRVRFKEQEVALYSGEIVLALEHLHKVTPQIQHSQSLSFQKISIAAYMLCVSLAPISFSCRSLALSIGTWNLRIFYWIQVVI